MPKAYIVMQYSNYSAITKPMQNVGALQSLLKTTYFQQKIV